MYLANANINDLKVENSTIINCFNQALAEKKIKIFYLFNPYTRTITYSFNDPTYGSCSFTIDSDGNIYNKYDSRLFPTIPLCDAFIQYLYNTEKAASDGVLKNLYPDLYEEEILKRNMTKKEKADYDKTKDKFRELLSTINTTVNADSKALNKAEAKEESLCFKIEISNHYSAFSFTITAYSTVTNHKYTFSDSFSRFVLKSEPIDEKSKEMLYTLSPLYYKPTYYYDKKEIKFAKMILGQGIKAMTSQNSKPSFMPLEFEGEAFELEKEIKNVQVSIDKDGHITSPYEKTSDNFVYDFENPKELVYFDMKKHLATYLTFATDTEKKLLLFKFENPMFDSKYFGKEISDSLVPTIKDVVDVEPSYLYKSMRLVDHIEYYIDLDKIKIELICKSKYFLSGHEVTSMEFDGVHSNELKAFVKARDSLNMPEEGHVEDERIIAEFITASLKALKKTCQIFISEDVKKLKKKSVGKINIIANSDQNWFGLKFQSNEYTDEELESILSAYKKKKKYFRLGNDILSLEEGDGKEMVSLLNDFDLKQPHMPVYQSLKLRGRDNVTLTNDLKNLFERVQDYDDQEISIDDRVKNILRPYQIKGIKWLTTLKESHLSGILADDMGLGKTLEIIAFLSQYHLDKPNLVVCPKSLTFNWADEFHKWDPKAKVVVLSSSKEDRHNKLLQMSNDNTTYIISYDSLRIDLDLFKDKSFGFLILDEGQYIANAFSKKSKAVKELSADYKFALTGTPIQNSLMDLWSIFDFLMPGYLKSFQDFKKTYGTYDLDEDDRKHLENIISPFLLKRKKEDVLTELPEKIVMTQNLVMESEESDLYTAYLYNARKVMEEKKVKGNNAGIEVLAALTRLRQLCVDPSCFLEYNKTSTKLDYTLTLIKEAIGKDHKIILFSSFTTVLDHLSTLLDTETIAHERIQGDTSAEKRIQLSKQFNETDNFKVMLISLKAGGTGLNLIGADIVIHLDPWWNLAAENQASDRAYRIGQTRKVVVYKLVMKNTIEEKVLELQAKKKNLSDIFDAASNKTSLSDEDIEYLLN